MARTALEALAKLYDDDRRTRMTCAELQQRLDDLGGIISLACVAHVWSVVLTVDGVPVARRQHADLVGALAAVVTAVEELRATAL